MSSAFDGKFRAFIERDGAKYGKIFDIFPAETNRLIDLKAPAFIIDCYSDKIFQEVTRYKKEFIIFVKNGRVTSFLVELFLLNHAYATGMNSVAGISLFDFATLAAKSFVGVGMNGIAESEMAATLFLEGSITGQNGWLDLYRFRDDTPSLRGAHDHFSRVASEFIFHHELGHEFVLDSRFSDLIYTYLDPLNASLMDLPSKLIRNIRNEIFSDSFAINVIFVKYSKIFNEKTMRNLCKIVLYSVIISITLNNIAHNLHKINVNCNHIAADLELEFTINKHRLAVVTKYIDEFQFNDKTTILCNPNGFNYEICFVEDLIPAILNGEKIVNPITKGSREVLQTLARIMIENPGQISRFIEEMRSYSRIDKDPLAERFIEERLRKLDRTPPQRE